MNWILLIIAGGFEVFWAISMKYSNGFTNLIPSILTIVGYIASLVFLTLAVKNLPISTSYAIWTGIGIIGTTVLGVFLFKDQLTIPQYICILLIVIGIIGLRLLGKE